jgi:hypothetical protein
MSLSSLYGPGVFRRLRPWRDSERRRRLCGELSAAAAGNGVNWRIGDGSDGVAPPPSIQLISVFSHPGAILEILRNNVVDHIGGEAEQEGGHEVLWGLRITI